MAEKRTSDCVRQGQRQGRPGDRRAGDGQTLGVASPSRSSLCRNVGVLTTWVGTDAKTNEHVGEGTAANASELF